MMCKVWSYTFYTPLKRYVILPLALGRTREGKKRRPPFLRLAFRQLQRAIWCMAACVAGVNFRQEFPFLILSLSPPHFFSFDGSHVYNVVTIYLYTNKQYIQEICTKSAAIGTQQGANLILTSFSLSLEARYISEKCLGCQHYTFQPSKVFLIGCVRKHFSLSSGCNMDHFVLKSSVKSRQISTFSCQKKPNSIPIANIENKVSLMWQ